MQKTFDNSSEPLSSLSEDAKIGYDKTPDAKKVPSSKKNALKNSAPKEHKESPQENPADYTIDPVTGIKYLRQKGFSDQIGFRGFKIPQIKVPGYQICAPLDKDISEIQRLTSLGWDFIDPNSPGMDQAKPVYAGTREDGKPQFHRFLMISNEKYQEIMAREQDEISRREEATIYNPLVGTTFGRNGYLPSEFGAPTTTRSAGDMDASMQRGLERAMR